jgi:hypothetical protein
MIFVSNDAVRLTQSELNTLRRENAKNGLAVNVVRTRQELLKSALNGLSPELQSDMLAFLEAVSSAGIREDRVPAA